MRAPLSPPPNLDSPEVRRHLDRFVRNVLGVADGVSVPEMPTRLARILLRSEEYETSARDLWGCWEYGMSDNFRRGKLWEPEVDVWISEIGRSLPDVDRLPLWPSGAPFVVSFSNRCFPTKAVAVWLGTNDQQHLRLVRAYFEGVKGWTEITGQDRSPGEDGDPLYAVWAATRTK